LGARKSKSGVYLDLLIGSVYNLWSRGGLDMCGELDKWIRVVEHFRFIVVKQEMIPLA
jgi:hypothetical protein